MSQLSKELNQRYIDELVNAKADSVFGRIYRFWWRHFLSSIKQEGVEKTLNSLDTCMTAGNLDFLASAKKYADGKNHADNQSKYIQIYNQYVKSNTGKMFERFVGLALAHSLQLSQSDYCILQFKKENLKHCHGLSVEDFAVSVRLGAKDLITAIDSDLIAFNPTNKNETIYMISIKSTLKDRFHNVPFWNLLRMVAVSGSFSTVKAKNPKVLSKVNYIAICSDLAQEQPDFTADTGPRKMLCIDAALLDGAFVSSARARGLGNDDKNIGSNRTSAFYPLSGFYRLLS